MIIRGIKVGTRSGLTAKRDGTVIWNPPIDVPPHSFPWSEGSRVMIAADNALVNLRSSTVISPSTLLGTVQSTRRRGTVQEGPIYNADNGYWWYRVLWDDEGMPNIGGAQGCWVGADELAVVVENRAPVAVDQAVSATVDTPVSITLAATDADGDVVAISVISQPTKGTLTGTPPNLTYLPTAAGGDAFSFRASDGVLSDDGLVTITNTAAVPPGEDVPVLLPRNGWTSNASSAQTGSPPDDAHDGRTDTYWRSQFSPTALQPPHALTITLGGALQQVMGFRYLPRQEGTSGHIGQYEFYTSEDGTTFSLKASGTWDENDITEKEVLITKTPARVVRLRVLAGTLGAASVAELGILVPQGEIVTPPPPVDPPPVDPDPDTPPTSGTTSLTSVTRNGVTWTFDKAMPVGWYCNGDPFVVGQVRIIAISPTYTVRTEYLNDGTPFSRKVNGTITDMTINPIYGDPYVQQGWDNAVSSSGTPNGFGTYSSSRNVAPANTGQALVCPANTTVVSSISTVGLPPNSSNSQIDRLAILTVVSVPPPQGSFRPAPFSPDKSPIAYESQLNYAILKSIAPIASTPSLSSVENNFTNWTTFHTGNAIQSMSPKQMPNYGKLISQRIADALFALNLNYTTAQKRNLYVSMVQFGIDIYGFLANGGYYRGAGGLNQGHKAPMVVAAAALNHAGMREWAAFDKRVTYKPPSTKLVKPFAEDSQLFYVSQSDVGRVLYTADGRPRDPYTQQHVGLPEWGEQHEIDKAYDGSNWTTFYRDINGTSLVAQALAIRMITGAEAVWDNPLFFAYYDRYWAREGALPFTNQSFISHRIEPYHWDMLKAHHSTFA